MITHGEFEMTDDSWTNVSRSAKDLVKKLLRTDPEKRLSAGEALHHLWFFVKLKANSLD
jgi:serine/threonine protein kinase